MKTSLVTCFFLFILANGIHAQALPNKQLIIVSEDSLKPIPFVHLISANKKVLSISDSSGVFIYPINSNQKEQLLILSHVGFETKTIAIELMEQKDTIRLKPLFFMFPTVLVKGKRESIDVEKVVYEAVSNFEKHRKNRTYLGKMTAKERAWIKKKPIMFLNVNGFAINNSIRDDATPLSNNTCIPTNGIGFINEPEYLDYYTTIDGIFHFPHLNIAPNVFRRIERKGILNTHNIENYSFKLGSISVKNNEVLATISFKKVKSNNIMRKLFDKVESYDKGSITIELTTNQINNLDFESYYTNLFTMHSSVPNELASGTITFAYVDSIPYLNRIVVNSTQAKLKHQVEMQVYTHLLSNFDASKKDYWDLNHFSIMPNIAFKDYPLQALKTLEPEFNTYFTNKYGDLSEYFKSNPVIFESKNKENKQLKDIEPIINLLMVQFE